MYLLEFLTPIISMFPNGVYSISPYMYMQTYMITHVESCVLLERVSNRKADSYVKLNVKMEDYYRIKDAEGGEMNG